MRKALIVLLIGGCVMFAQSAGNVDLLDKTEQLRRLISAGDWQNASELSRELRNAVIEARDRSLAGRSDVLVNSVLSWLPANTETAIVAQQLFTIRLQDDASTRTALEAAQDFVLGLFDFAEKETLVKAFLGKTIRTAVLAARQFHNQLPVDNESRLPLGLIAYEGCAVYAFTDTLPEPVLSRPPDETLLGQRLWISKGSPNDTPDSDTYLLTAIAPDLMVVCNNREFLQEILSRRSSPHQPRALPADLPEWNQVHRTAPLWAISHYANGGIVQK